LAKSTFPSTVTLDYAIGGQPFVATATVVTATVRPQVMCIT